MCYEVDFKNINIVPTVFIVYRSSCVYVFSVRRCIVNNKFNEEYLVKSDLIKTSINDINTQLSEKRIVLSEKISERVIINKNLVSLNGNIEYLENKLKKLNKPRWWEYVVFYVKGKQLSKSKQKKIDDLNAALAIKKNESLGYSDKILELNDGIDDINSDISGLSDDVSGYRDKEALLTVTLTKITQDGEFGALVNLYKSNQGTILLYAILAYLSFYLTIPIKAFKYWLLSPFAESFKSIQLVERVQGKLLASESSEELAVPIKNKPLLIKPDWYHQINHGKVSSILIYSWGSIFASYALGLVNMVRFDSMGKNVINILLSNKKHENTVIMEISLKNHCGLAVRRNHVIALTEGLKIKTIYKFSNLSSWVFGRFKYYLITGTGSIYIYGIQGIEQGAESAGDNSFIQDHLLAFDASDEFSLKRRPPFLPYLQGSQALFDISFSKGASVFRQKVIKSSNPQFFRSFLDDVLKVLDVISGRA